MTVTGFRLSFLPVVTMLLFGFGLTCSDAARGELFINEIFWDPGGEGNDNQDEFIELRGTPGSSLANHYLIIVEAEDDLLNTGFAGVVENMFDFGIMDGGSPATIGFNGFTVLLQQNSRYGTVSGTGVNLLANVYQNVSPGTGQNRGWGNGANSTIGAMDQGPVYGSIENSGFTAMLIRIVGDPVMDRPVIGMDLDAENDGILDTPNGHQGWEIIDSIGFTVEDDEERTALYGKVNFVKEGLSPAFDPSETSLTFVDFEMEHIARWGNSTGYTADDWHVFNATDKVAAGSSGAIPDYRLSALSDATGDGSNGEPTGWANVESNKVDAYGLRTTNTLGTPNFISGDFNQDGYVNLADYTVWRDTLGQTGADDVFLAADHNNDYVVDALDYQIWKANFGAPLLPLSPSALGSQVSVPEPSSLVLLMLLVGVVGWSRRRVSA